MKSLNKLALTSAAGLMAASAMAQAPAPAPAAPPAPAATPAPAAPAAPATDAEISQFATALLGVNEVQKDTTLADADKQKAMVAKVQASGLDPQRFNELARALQSGDAEFQKKVQVELAKKQTPPAG